MRSQACAQVISGWRRRRPSLKRRSTAPLAIGVTPGSSAASSSERARCRGGAGASGGQGRTCGALKTVGVTLPDCRTRRRTRVSHLSLASGGSQAAPLQLHCSSTALSGGWLGALAHVGCGVAAALAARVDPHRVDAERVGGGEHRALPAERVEDT